MLCEVSPRAKEITCRESYDKRGWLLKLTLAYVHKMFAMLCAMLWDGMDPIDPVQWESASLATAAALASRSAVSLTNIALSAHSIFARPCISNSDTFEVPSRTNDRIIFACTFTASYCASNGLLSSWNCLIWMSLASFGRMRPWPCYYTAVQIPFVACQSYKTACFPIHMCQSCTSKDQTVISFVSLLNMPAALKWKTYYLTTLSLSGEAKTMMPIKDILEPSSAVNI